MQHEGARFGLPRVPANTRGDDSAQVLPRCGRLDIFKNGLILLSSALLDSQAQATTSVGTPRLIRAANEKASAVLAHIAILGTSESRL